MELVKNWNEELHKEKRGTDIEGTKYKFERAEVQITTSGDKWRKRLAVMTWEFW